MEPLKVKNMELQIAGILAILTGIGHAYLGDVNIKSQAISPPREKINIRACYQFGSLGWIVGGVLFIGAPFTHQSPAHFWIVFAFMPLFAFAAMVNFWFSKGRHFGWVMLLGIIVLSMLSLR